MLQAMRCPECGAPLDPPGGGAVSMRCPYCRSTVLLSDARAAGNRPGQVVARGAVRGVMRSKGKWGLPVALTVLTILGCCAGLVAYVISVMNTALPNRGYNGSPVVTRVPSISIPSNLMPPKPVVPAFAKVVREFGSEGIGAGQFKDARSIAIDGAGHIYVGEYGGGRVQVFDSSGKFLKLWSIEGKGYLSNLCASHDGTVLAVFNGKILLFEGMTGKPISKADQSYNDSDLYYNDACFTLTGDIYGLDYSSNIVVMDGAGLIKHVIQAKQNSGDDDASFERIAVNGNGQIYAVDKKGGIFQFAADGHYINRFGGNEDDNPTDMRPDVLHSAMSLAIDGQGRIFCGDLNPAIKVFDANGRFLGSYGDYQVCFGIAIDDHNRIFGCFRNDHVVRGLELVGK